MDLLLVERGVAASRGEAQRLILAGEVEAGTVRIRKPGQVVARDTPLRLLQGPRFVGRGGLKLEGGLEDLQVDPRGKVCLDVGVSTGGFTDCLLQGGASRVYCVDVGRGQIHPKIRGDRRVVLLEKTNIRHLRELPEPVELAVVDVSFISLDLVWPALQRLLRPGGELLALVKPQFELSPKEVRKGVVRDESLRRKAVERVTLSSQKWGFEPLGQSPSRLVGAKGNREIFLHLRFRAATGPARDSLV